MSDFCEVEHTNARQGCFGEPKHRGKHWSYSSHVHDKTGQRDNEHGNMIWEWEDDTPEVPAGSAALVLNDAELGILLTTLDPVKQFFPDLSAKLIEVRRRLQK